MANKITFRMVAWTDAAGKYDPSAPLGGNEDNYYVDDNLGDATPNHFVADEDVVLSECGMIMAVADGMGGMNAGEVASQIAHDTVAEFFAPGKITPQLAATHESRSRYIESVIREADRRIKADARHNREHEGMGSTLIMAWLANDELSVTWIGDSRAYRFNPNSGIEPLSKDHSYVQELADKGIITYEQTFEHPQGNIITRSLGDGSQKARPESRLFKVHDGDIILLCSDGLSGVLRDRKTFDENGEPYSGENMEDIMRENSSSLSECREALWAAAERADWYDNVTAILCEIRSGAGAYLPAEDNAGTVNASDSTKNKLHKTFDGFVIKIPRKKLMTFLALLLLIVFVVGGGVWYKIKKQTPIEEFAAVPDTTNIVGADSVKVDSGKQEINKNVGISSDGNKESDKEEREQDEEKEKKESDTVKGKPQSPLGFTLEPINKPKEDDKDKSELTPVGRQDELTPAQNGKK